jgi:hypothetical protein
MKHDPKDFNQATNDILTTVNQFLKVNKKSDPKVFFKEIDKDGSMSVDLNEFIGYFDKIKHQNDGKESEVDKKINK